MRKPIDSRNYTPDPLDLLGEDLDGSSRDWYANSSVFDADVEGENSYACDADDSPDFGPYWDANSKAFNSDRFQPLVTSEDD